MLQSEHLGPIDVAVIGFVGGAKRDEVAAAIIDLVDAGTVRIIDLAYVEKDIDGEVGMLEVVDADIADAFAAIDESFDLLNEEEILAVGDELEPGSGALLVVWENTWARDLAFAVREAGGAMIGFQRVPHEVVAEAVAAMNEALEEN